MKEVTAQSYTLWTDNGGWLGQVVLTSDGMFAAVTDYGNFSYAWRSFGDRPFADFLLQLKPDYFADKMTQGFAYTLLHKKIDKGAALFAAKILPALQAVLREEKVNGVPVAAFINRQSRVIANASERESSSN